MNSVEGLRMDLFLKKIVPNDFHFNKCFDKNRGTIHRKLNQKAYRPAKIECISDEHTKT